jgi:hypothetical protein
MIVHAGLVNIAAAPGANFPGPQKAASSSPRLAREPRPPGPWAADFVSESVIPRAAQLPRRFLVSAVLSTADDLGTGKGSDADAGGSSFASIAFRHRMRGDSGKRLAAIVSRSSSAMTALSSSLRSAGTPVPGTTCGVPSHGVLFWPLSIAANPVAAMRFLPPAASRR